jgi:hypothetical protein
LLDRLCPSLAQLPGVHAVRLAVADSAVAAAAKRRMESHPPLPAAATVMVTSEVAVKVPSDAVIV